MVSIYEVEGVRALVLDFYEKAWKSTDATRKVFEQIGYELTTSAINMDTLLQNLNNVDKLYAGPIARAGCGLFRPHVIKLLEKICTANGVRFESFAMGLRRSDNPLQNPAIVYWNTLQRISDLNLSSSTILLYEMGEATGSTIEGAINELRRLKAPPHNVVVLIGAACIEQTKSRLEAVAPDLNLVIGSRWRYDDTPGPTQYYLTHILNDGWTPVSPRDWGQCVSGMTDIESVDSFIDWIRETLQISNNEQKILRQDWSSKINEKIIGPRR
jgi:uracil phosphoribosyltransferase